MQRILTGEILLISEIRENENKKLQQELVKNLCHFVKNPTNSEFRLKLQDILEKLSVSQGFLKERRDAIKKIVKKVFLEKNKKDIMRGINSILKEILGKNLISNGEVIEYVRDLEKNKKLDFPIFIDDYAYDCFKGANYDLRLGENVFVTTEKTPRKLTYLGLNGTLSIEPGEFGILMTHEYVFVPPDLIGFISIRLTFKQKGLVNISGFHVDPGFYGRLMFAVFNAGPNDVVLRYKEPVFMIMFDRLEEEPPVVKESKWHDMTDIPVETIFGLRGTSISVRNLDERVKRLEMVFPVIVTGIASVVVGIIVWLFTKAWSG